MERSGVEDMRLFEGKDSCSKGVRVGYVSVCGVGFVLVCDVGCVSVCGVVCGVGCVLVCGVWCGVGYVGVVCVMCVWVCGVGQEVVR